MVSRFLALVRNSFAEIIRQPIYGILIAMGMVMIAFSPIITMFTMMEDVKLMVDMGLGTIFMVGIVLAVLSATQVISREIESKTAGAVISKPVGRVVFLIGKFVGVSLAMGMASMIFIVILLMSLRMGVPMTVNYTLDWPVFMGELIPFVVAVFLGLYTNYFYRWSFTATAVRVAGVLYPLSLVALIFVNKHWHFTWIAMGFVTNNAFQVFLAAVLVALGVWLISAVAVAASTRVDVVPNVLICLAVFFTGMVSHYLFGWTVDDAWVRWEPRPGAETVKISGRVLSAGGNPLRGVEIKGAPGEVATGISGQFTARVQKGQSGQINPEMEGYRFEPAQRRYVDVETDVKRQLFTAHPRELDTGYYLQKVWWWGARGAYHIVPSLQFFWVADQLMRPAPYIPLSYVGKALLYAGSWCAAMIALGAFLFERREII